VHGRAVCESRFRAGDVEAGLGKTGGQAKACPTFGQAKACPTFGQAKACPTDTSGVEVLSKRVGHVRPLRKIHVGRQHEDGLSEIRCGGRGSRTFAVRHRPPMAWIASTSELGRWLAVISYVSTTDPLISDGKAKGAIPPTGCYGFESNVSSPGSSGSDLR
jgi:hypothetical protein